jgi:hypothetical protein
MLHHERISIEFRISQANQTQRISRLVKKRTSQLFLSQLHFSPKKKQFGFTSNSSLLRPNKCKTPVTPLLGDRVCSKKNHKISTQ